MRRRSDQDPQYLINLGIKVAATRSYVALGSRRGDAKVALLRKNAVKVLEAFDLDRVPARIEEEHGALFTGLAFEADDRRNVESDATAFEAIGKCEPLVEWQDNTKMGHHHHVVADLAGPRRLERLAEMKRNLMAVEVEIDPGLGAAAFGATQHVAVEAATVIEIFDMVGEVRLFTIMRNTFCTSYKRRVREPVLANDMAAMHLTCDAPQLEHLRFKELTRAIQKLPDDARNALRLTASGTSYEEAARICRCKPGTVKSRVNRARYDLGVAIGEIDVNAVRH